MLDSYIIFGKWLGDNRIRFIDNKNGFWLSIKWNNLNDNTIMFMFLKHHTTNLTHTELLDFGKWIGRSKMTYMGDDLWIDKNYKPIFHREILSKYKELC